MTKRVILSFGLFICAGVVHATLLQDADPKAGKQVATACAACHGPQGNMESPQFPKLAGQGAPYIYEQLKLFKSGKRENAIMAGQAAGLDDQAMKNVAAYFAGQQTKPGAADESIAPAGAHLYHGGAPDKGIPACSGCHGPSGLGNPAAKFPRLSGQSPGYIVTQLKAYRDGTRKGYANAKIMNGVASGLSDEDIKALASYVAGLAPAGNNAKNDKGALMQKVSGPAAAGAEGNTSDSGQKPAGDNADTGADNADAAAAGDTAQQTGTPADDSKTPSSADSEKSKAAPEKAGQGAAASDTGAAGKTDQSASAQAGDKKTRGAANQQGKAKDTQSKNSKPSAEKNSKKNDNGPAEPDRKSAPGSNAGKAKAAGESGEPDSGVNPAGKSGSQDNAGTGGNQDTPGTDSGSSGDAKADQPPVDDLGDDSNQ